MPTEGILPTKPWPVRAFFAGSIQRTLIAIIFGVSSISIIVGFSVNTAIDISRIKQGLLNESELNARLTGRYCVVPLTFDYQDEAEEVLRGLDVLPETLDACIYTPQGEIFASYHRSAEHPIAFPEKPGETTFRGRFLHLFHQIEFGGDPYGILYLRVSAEAVTERIKRQLAVTGALILSLALLSFVLAQRLQHLVSAPLLGLADVAGDITEKNDYSLRAETDRTDEIGTLYSRFNDLCAQVERRERERDRALTKLLGYQDHLEDLVKERTAELERMSQDLRRALVDAEAASTAKSEFLANMSHEIRTPLGAILGFAQLMQRDRGLTEEQRAHVDTIERSGGHLLALINEILEMAKIEAGRVKIDMSHFDLHQLISDLETMFEVRTRAKGLQLSVDVGKKVSRIIETDQGKLRQILINLIGNAVKFTDSGNVALRIETRAIDEENMLIVKVSDTGIGIAEKSLDAVFDHFEQTTVGVDAKGGTGLGLAISRQHARLLGGDITVTSSLGEGSVFRFAIPVKHGQADLVAWASADRRVSGLAPGQPSCRVLVADDRRDNRLLMVTLLSQVGFDVVQARDGREAVDLFVESYPRVVLMDIAMPVMDGKEATRHIRATPRGNETVIIAVTASAFEEQLRDLGTQGFDGTVRKPFRESELLDAIGRLAGIEYIYEEQPELSAASTESDATSVNLLKKNVGALPDELVDRLREMTAGGYMEQLRGCLEEAEDYDESVAHCLRKLADSFEYDLILEVLQGERAP